MANAVLTAFATHEMGWGLGLGLGRYAAAATLARLADEMVGVAVVLLVLDRTGSAALAGAAVAGYTLPAVVTGPVLGAWLGRARRPVLALAANELVLAGVAVGLVLGVGRLSGVVVVGLTGLAGIGLPLTSGGFSSLVPRIVPAGGLDRANVTDAVTFNLAAIGGPALAGALAATLGSATAVTVLALLAMAAVVATVLLGPVSTPAGDMSIGLLRTASTGLAHLVRTPPLRGATLASMLSIGGAGLLVVAFPARAAELGAPRASAGYLWAAAEIGCALSTVFVTPRLGRFRPEYVVFTAVAGYGLVIACWTLAGSLLVTLGLAVLAGIMDGPALPALFGARQRYSPRPLLAQVATTGASLKIGSFAVGSALSGRLTPVLGPVTMLLLAAAVQLAGTAAGYLVSGNGRSNGD